MSCGRLLRVLKIGNVPSIRFLPFNRLGYSVYEYCPDFQALKYDVVLYCNDNSPNDLRSDLNVVEILSLVKDANPHVWISYDLKGTLIENGHATLSTVLTVNRSTAESIVGKAIRNSVDISECVEILRSLGFSTCFMRGLEIDDVKISNVLFANNKIYRLDCARVTHSLVSDGSCGEIMFALLSILLHKHRDHPPTALDLACRIMTNIISEASSKPITDLSKVLGDPEHALSLSAMITSDGSLPVQRRSDVYLCSGRVRGVIFDMDGTLTEPGAIDFKAMYSRCGMVSKGSDILSQIAVDFADDPEGHDRALRIIEEEEMKGCERMVLRSDLHDVIAKLCSKSVRLAVSTRNCQVAYEKFIDMCDLDNETFHPVLSRESLGAINKPDPQVARHILDKWDISEPDTVWFVGDSMDDIRCGKGAGCMTCLVGSDENRKMHAQHGFMIDMHADSLSEFYNKISHWL